MSTWNFPVWLPGDEYNGTRNRVGHAVLTGNDSIPGYGGIGTAHSFSDTYTFIFCFNFVTGWSVATGSAATDYIVTFGNDDASNRWFTDIKVRPGSGGRFLQVISTDLSSGDTVTNVVMTDEDDADVNTGTIQMDKWYQAAVSHKPTETTYALNGVSAPTASYSVGVGGDPNLDQLQRMLWGNSAAGTLRTISKTSGWPSCALGPMLMHNAYIDLTDSDVLANIYDDDGNFKFAGTSGQNWLGGTTPLWYFPFYSPLFRYGTDKANTFYQDGGGGSGFRQGAMSGFRVMYE